MSETHDSLTILLTLKGRVELTKRWLSYLEYAKCQFPIVLADGSNDDDQEYVSKLLANYSSLKITHKRFPEDQSWHDFFAKVEKCYSELDTPLVLMADNDDFYLVDNLEMIVEGMIKKPDLVSSCGDWLNIRLGSSNSGSSYEISHIGKRQSLDCDKLEERLEVFKDESYKANINLFNCWYSVFKVNTIHEFYQLICRCGFPEVGIVEYYLFLFNALSGPSAALDCVHYVRTENFNNSSTEELHSKKGMVRDQILWGDWVQKNQILISEIAKHFSNKFSMDELQLTKKIQEAFSPVLIRYFTRYYLNLSTQSSKKVNKPILQEKSISRFLNRFRDKAKSNNPLCGQLSQDRSISQFFEFVEHYS